MNKPFAQRIGFHLAASDTTPSELLRVSLAIALIFGITGFSYAADSLLVREIEYRTVGPDLIPQNVTLLSGNSYANTYPGSTLTTVTGIRANNMTGNFNITGTLNTGGLLWNLSSGTASPFPYATANSSNFPTPAGSATVVSSTPYGPNWGSQNGILRVVGSYMTTASPYDLGYLYDGATASGPRTTTLAYPSGVNVRGQQATTLYTIAHSNFGNQVVGNYDTQLSTGNAFIYDIPTGTYRSLNKPSAGDPSGFAVSTTAYGIYGNRIAGGYTEVPGGPRAYIYNQDTNVFRTYEAPVGHTVTHFEGITGGGQRDTFNLIADSIEIATQKAHAWVVHVDANGNATWQEIKIGDATVSANSIYQNRMIGVYVENGITKAYEVSIPGIYNPQVNSNQVVSNAPGAVVINGDGDDVQNSGSIIVNGARSQGILNAHFGAITNSGSITANGTDSAAVVMGGRFGTLLNSGTIRAASGAYAIQSDSTSLGTVVVNTGTIDGQVNINAGPFARFENSGWLGISGNAAPGTSVAHQISGTFVQTASGTYAPRMTPTSNDSLAVSGTAIVGGTLAVNAAPGTYDIGNRFNVLTAGAPVLGTYSTIIQPSSIDASNQLIAFYNMNNTNAVTLAVVPTSYQTYLSSANSNTKSVAGAADVVLAANIAGTASATQNALLYGISGKNGSSLSAFLNSLSGENYAATLAVVPQATQRLQQSVISRLGDTMTAPAMAGAMAMAGNSAISATNPGGQPTAAMSSNPAVNPHAPQAGGMSFTNGAAWGEIAYQYGNRSADSNSGGWNSNLVQVVAGTDIFSQDGKKIGAGLAYSNTSVNAAQGSGTVQQGSLFLYGKLPIDLFVLDAMASYGLNNTSNSRTDPINVNANLQAKSVSGNDALLSLGLNLPIETASALITPYARATWQQVSQSGFTDGVTPAALAVNSFYGNGVRGVLGVALGSKAVDPLKESITYRANVGVGVDSSPLLNPVLTATLAGTATTINTPAAGNAFIQAGIYATARFADNAFAYAGITAEGRSGQILAGGNVGVRVHF